MKPVRQQLRTQRDAERRVRQHAERAYAGGRHSRVSPPPRRGAAGVLRKGGTAWPSFDCMGLSDTRGFGVCMYGLPCWEDPDPYTRSLWDDCNRDRDRRPCACMVLEPQPAEAPIPRGNLVLADACLAYAAAYPGGVECRDIDWALLP